MQTITKAQFKRALAAREKLAAGAVAGPSTDAEVDAKRRPATTQKTLRLAAQSRYEAAKYLAEGGGFLGRRVALLDEPFFHYLTWTPHLPSGHSDIEGDSAVEPGNSWVKVHVDDDGSVTKGMEVLDRLRFFYVWTNPTGNSTVVDVSAYMTLSGAWEAQADVWGEHIAPGNPNYDPDGGPGQVELKPGHAHLRLSANLALYEWWNQPPTLAPVQNVPDQETQTGLVDVALHATVPNSISKSGYLFNFFELKQHLLVIPREGTLVAEVSFDVDHQANHGRVIANFDSDKGDRITSHWVQIAYVVAPPLTITPFAVPPPAKNP
jgi:hypothetical protein